MYLCKAVSASIIGFILHEEQAPMPETLYMSTCTPLEPLPHQLAGELQEGWSQILALPIQIVSIKVKPS